MADLGLGILRVGSGGGVEGTARGGAYLGYARDPWDNDRAAFSATATINREDWGLTWNMVLDTGGLLVSKQIRWTIGVELLRQ